MNGAWPPRGSAHAATELASEVAEIWRNERRSMDVHAGWSVLGALGAAIFRAITPRDYSPGFP
jgi:hypothetical protein